MGLLDQLSGLAPEQNQGLLAAAAQMLQASGPSRMPTSFGQVLGQGIGSYQNAMTAQQEAAQRKAIFEQAQALNGFKLKDAESDLKAQEAQRDEARRYAEFMRNRGAGGATSPMPAGQPAAAAFAGAMNPQQPQAPAQEPTASANMNMAVYQKRMQLAEDLRNAGFVTQAAAEEASALKFQPKVKGWEKVQQGGKVMFAPFFEDGSSGAPVPLEVAEKLEFKNTGGKTLGLNPFTGAQVSSYANTVDPNTVYSGNITMRGQNMTDARAREQLNQGKIPAGYRATADGGLEAIPGGPAADKVTNPQQKLADAKDVITLLDQAEPLVKKATGSYGGVALDAGARLFGKSTDGAEAAAQLSALEGMLVSKMPKMSGPQSDKDVAMYKQMAGKIGDPTLPAESKLAAMKTIREINQRYIDATPAKAERKVATLADIAATAKASGKSTAEVTAALRAQGYTIGGK